MPEISRNSLNELEKTIEPLGTRNDFSIGNPMDAHLSAELSTDLNNQMKYFRSQKDSNLIGINPRNENQAFSGKEKIKIKQFSHENANNEKKLFLFRSPATTENSLPGYDTLSYDVQNSTPSTWSSIDTSTSSFSVSYQTSRKKPQIDHTNVYSQLNNIREESGAAHENYVAFPNVHNAISGNQSSSLYARSTHDNLQDFFGDEGESSVKTSSDAQTTATSNSSKNEKPNQFITYEFNNMDLSTISGNWNNIEVAEANDIPPNQIFMKEEGKKSRCQQLTSPLKLVLILSVFFWIVPALVMIIGKMKYSGGTESEPPNSSAPETNSVSKKNFVKSRSKHPTPQVAIPVEPMITSSPIATRIHLDPIPTNHPSRTPFTNPDLSYPSESPSKIVFSLSEEPPTTSRFAITGNSFLSRHHVLRALENPVKMSVDAMFSKELSLLESLYEADFFIHLGDFNYYSVEDCNEELYKKNSNVFKEYSPVPSFVVMGESEWNLCTDPDQAMKYWLHEFAFMESEWTSTFGARSMNDDSTEEVIQIEPKSQLGNFVVERPVSHEYDFTFVRNRILFLGLNVVDAKKVFYDETIDAQSETLSTTSKLDLFPSVEDWKGRLESTLHWIEMHLDRGVGDRFDVVVIFANGNPNTPENRDFLVSLTAMLHQYKVPAVYFYEASSGEHDYNFYHEDDHDFDTTEKSKGNDETRFADHDIAKKRNRSRRPGVRRMVENMNYRISRSTPIKIVPVQGGVMPFMTVEVDASDKLNPFRILF